MADFSLFKSGLLARIRTGTGLAIAVAGLVTGLAGCGSTLKLVPHELTTYKATATPRKLWSVSVGSAKPGHFLTPALADVYAYAAASDGTLVRVDLATGHFWRVNVGQEISAGVGADKDSVAVVSTTGDLLVFDTAGKQRWKAAVNAEVLSAPLVGQGLIVVRTSDSRVFAFDANTGVRKWNFQRTPQPLVLRSAPGMVTQGGLMFTGFPGGRLVAVQMTTGGLRWDSAIAIPRGATELERVADVVGTPVLSGMDVCAASFQGRAGCYEQVSGNTVWQRDISTTTGLDADSSNAYVTDEKSIVQAFSRENGTSVWRNDALLYRRASAPVALGKNVAVGDYEGYVHWLARDSGALVARISTDGSEVAVAPLSFIAGDKNAAVILTRKGELSALTAD